MALQLTSYSEINDLVRGSVQQFAVKGCRWVRLNFIIAPNLPSRSS